jgi:hypothetical protein
MSREKLNFFEFSFMPLNTASEAISMPNFPSPSPNFQNKLEGFPPFLTKTGTEVEQLRPKLIIPKSTKPTLPSTAVNAIGKQLQYMLN